MKITYLKYSFRNVTQTSVPCGQSGQNGLPVLQLVVEVKRYDRESVCYQMDPAARVFIVQANQKKRKHAIRKNVQV